MLVFSGAVVAERFRFYDAPLYGDVCAFCVFGHEMLAGRHLYSDLWDHKPPLLYATFAGAELLVGYGRQEIFLVNTASAVLILVGVYFAGRDSAYGRIGGLIGAGLWVLLGCDLDLLASMPLAELFINVFITASFALLVSWPERRSLKLAAMLGLLMAGATLYKHNMLIVCVALCAGHVLARAASLRRVEGSRFLEATVAGSVIAVVWLGLFAWFAAVGRLHDFVDVLFHQNLTYSGSLANNIVRSARVDHLFPGFMIWVVGPAILVVLSALAAVRASARLSSQWILWIFWAIGVWVTIALEGYLYPHYYQLWIPVWCVAGAWAAAALLRPGISLPSVVRYAALGIVAMTLCFRQLSQFLMTSQQWATRQIPYFNLVEQNQLGRDIGALLKPDEKFWELGEDNALYFFARHDPPTGILYINPLIYGDETEIYWQQLLSDLNRNRPDLIVIASAWSPLIPTDAPIFGWIRQQDYVSAPNPAYPAYRFLVRRGSALERRLSSTGDSGSVAPH